MTAPETNYISESETTHWDRRFLQLADTIASWSEDTSRKVGCVIVGQENGILSTGFNGLPRGISFSEKRNSRVNAEKYYWYEHAERNAIYNAVRSGTTLLDSRIYVNLFPCSDCTRAIIQSGVRQLNTFQLAGEDEHYKRSFEVSFEMLVEAKIEIRFFQPKR